MSEVCPNCGTTTMIEEEFGHYQKTLAEVTSLREKNVALTSALADMYKQKFGNMIRWPGDSFHDYLQTHKETLDRALFGAEKLLGDVK